MAIVIKEPQTSKTRKNQGLTIEANRGIIFLESYGPNLALEVRYEDPRNLGSLAG